MGTIRVVADAVIVAQWFTISAYFLVRYARYRKLVSIALSLMSCGWALAGIDGFIERSEVGRIIVDTAALLIGAFVWYAVVRVERTGK